MPYGENTSDVEMTEWLCASCGCVMWMPSELMDHLRGNHNTFYCVSGHGNVFGQTEEQAEAEELKQKLLVEYTKNAQLESVVKQLRGPSIFSKIFSKKSNSKQ
jgi:hypothetical protein